MNLRTYKRHDDVFFRQVIYGVLNLLHERVFIKGLYEDTELYKIPVYYTYGTGDERFLQDKYHKDITIYPDACASEFAEGSYDPIPRGVLMNPTFQVDSGKFTNPHVRGILQEIKNDEVQEINSHLWPVPITMTFQIEYLADTMLESFIIIQTLIETLSRVPRFDVMYKGRSIPCQLTFSDDRSIDGHNYTFKYDEKNQKIVKAQITVETHMPVLEKTNLRFAHETMESIETSNQEKYPGQNILDGVEILLDRVLPNNPHFGDNTVLD